MKLPLDFIRSRARLSWAEVEYGIHNGWIDPEAAIEVAVAQIGDEQHPVYHIAILAGLLPHQTARVPEIVGHLARKDPELSKGKWLYLLLAWLYENRDQVPDAFQMIEQIYADFDYPDEIRDFVRYMPARDPERVGERYMIESWRQYLERAADTFGPDNREAPR